MQNTRRNELNKKQDYHAHGLTDGYKNRKLELITTTSAHRDELSRCMQTLIINWIPFNTGIAGYEKTDKEIQKGLQLGIMHNTVSASMFRLQRMMMEYRRRHFIRKHTRTTSQGTKDNR